MKLSQETIDIFALFSKINDSIILTPGNAVYTKSEDSKMVARAEIAETIPEKAPLFRSLDKLVRIAKLLKDPDIEFTREKIVVKSGRFSQTIVLSDPSYIVAPKGDPADRQIDWNVQFNLSRAEVELISKAASITNAPHFVIESDGEGPIRVVGTDEKSSSTDHHVFVTDTSSADKFRIILSRSCLLFEPADYEISICCESNCRVASFLRLGSDKRALQYWIALEDGSTYEAA